MQPAGTGRPPGKGVHVTAKSSLIISRTWEAGKAHSGPALSFINAYNRPGWPGAISSVSTCQDSWLLASTAWIGVAADVGARGAGSAVAGPEEQAPATNIAIARTKAR
jgi:hypothetical protein